MDVFAFSGFTDIFYRVKVFFLNTFRWLKLQIKLSVCFYKLEFEPSSTIVKTGIFLEWARIRKIKKQKTSN